MKQLRAIQNNGYNLIQSNCYSNMYGELFTYEFKNEGNRLSFIIERIDSFGRINSFQKSKLSLLLFLKAIACLLILNSHCRDIYPIMFLGSRWRLRKRAVFCVIGFCLVNIQQSFFQVLEAKFGEFYQYHCWL